MYELHTYNFNYIFCSEATTLEVTKSRKSMIIIVINLTNRLIDLVGFFWYTLELFFQYFKQSQSFPLTLLHLLQQSPTPKECLLFTCVELWRIWLICWSQRQTLLTNRIAKKNRDSFGVALSCIIERNWCCTKG